MPRLVKELDIKRLSRQWTIDYRSSKITELALRYFVTLHG